MRQYEIWWAALPEPAGTRPVMILTRTQALRYLTRILVAEVTTTVRGIPQEVSLGPRDGLSRKCVANLDGTRAIQTARLRSRAGAIPPARRADVKRALGHVLAWSELTALA